MLPDADNDITVPPSEPDIGEVLDVFAGAGAKELAMTVRRLAFQRDMLLKDQERLNYILDNHLKSHSPHMNSTFGFSFRGPLNGLHRNGRDALDAAIEQAATWRREAAQSLLEQAGEGPDVQLPP